MRHAAALLIFLWACHSVFGQEEPLKHSVFGCSAGAVDVNLDKAPPLRFALLSNPPQGVEFGGERHKFVFREAVPFHHVDIYLSATLPESRVGRASTAKLHVYVTTEASNEDYQKRIVHWWKLEPTGLVQNEQEEGASSLTFDATRIGSCFGQKGDCSFAGVATATSDPDVPLVAIKFSQNLGGANAENWTEATLLLDFRSSPPTVLATAECGYNEGGGACTAYDSGQMPRYELQCDWGGESKDFLCSQISSPAGEGHWDFFLLNDKPAPLRGDEVATLQDAVRQFRAKGTAAPVKVRGIGPVSWIDEINTNGHDKVIVLGSPVLFHFIPESSAGIGQPVDVRSRDVIGGPESSANPAIKAEGFDWTQELAAAFHSRQIYTDRDLTVLQVVRTTLPESQELFWLGIPRQTADKYDVVQLVGGGRYAGCAEFVEPENIASIGKIAKPFTAQVRIQPATRSAENDDQAYRWNGSDENPEISECILPGQIIWKDRQFVVTMDEFECASREQPKYIKVDVSGTIVLIDHNPK